MAHKQYYKNDIKELASSVDEMKRILNCVDHYEALGFPRHKTTDAKILNQEYRKKAMLVHPDKNVGSSQASESFKKLQCAYEGNQDYRSEETRCIQCTKCGLSHIWLCTNRSKAKHHQAKDGDGWVEYRGSLVFECPQKVEIPRAFVCAESKIFDVSEWAICQGMACRPNTHWPSFHVNMVGLEKTQRSKSCRFPWDLDVEMMDEDEEAFELWLQQALASGLFCECSKRRKSWSPFNLHNKKGKKEKQWHRRTSC
ncbi:hypothetical protein SO802_010564 [Lithocarpus litseifolius]|uniref:J domain-containing protein n=1 Tax=Lithocarpus litseifolius TaxID=425828 RepID=A0AAW2DGT5_9ROSI